MKFNKEAKTLAKIKIFIGVLLLFIYIYNIVTFFSEDHNIKTNILIIGLLIFTFLFVPAGVYLTWDGIDIVKKINKREEKEKQKKLENNNDEINNIDGNCK